MTKRRHVQNLQDLHIYLCNAVDFIQYMVYHKRVYLKVKMP